MSETRTTIVLAHDEKTRPRVNCSTEILGCTPCVIAAGDLSADVEALENTIEQAVFAIQDGDVQKAYDILCPQNVIST